MKKTLLLMVLFVTGGLSAQAQLLDVQFGGNTYNSNGNSDLQTGAGIVGSSGDQWNDIVFSGSQYNSYTTSLDTVGGVGSGVSLTIVPANVLLDEYSNGPVSATNPTPSVLPGTPLANLYEGFLNADSNPYVTPTSSTFTFSGLTAGESYNLYVYSAPNIDRASNWSLNGATPVQVGTNSGATTLESPNNYILLNGIANSSDQLVLRATSVGGSEIDVNGLQLQAQAAPEPSTYALVLGGLLALIALRRKSRLSV